MDVRGLKAPKQPSRRLQSLAGFGAGSVLVSILLKGIWTVGQTGVKALVNRGLWMEKNEGLSKFNLDRVEEAAGEWVRW